MNIAIIKQSGGKYLFEVPENIMLKEGEKVRCDTRRGVTEGVCYADSVIVDEPIAMLIGKLTGAKFPLKKVVGKMEYQPFEKPTEDKPEPIKLYCVEADEGYLTKGKIYELDADGKLVYDCCETSGRYKTVDAFFRDYSSWKACLVPLVSRPAEVGEWVYIESKIDNYAYNVGDIGKVEKTYTQSGDIRAFGGQFIFQTEYLVLDGYKPEPEKAESEYYNGKVVCVSGADAGVTVGKVYDIKNGIIRWNNGISTQTGAKTFDEFNSWFIAAKFVEFKGE